MRIEERTAELAMSNKQLQNEITERVQAARALREERDRAQSYLDVAGVMLVVFGADGKISLINKKGCEILAYKENEIIGKNWFDNFIPERTKNDVKAVFAKLMAGETGAIEYFENPILTGINEERIIAWHNTVLKDEAGNGTGILSSGEDITERKKMEEELIKAQKLESLGVLAGSIANDFNNILTAILGSVSFARMTANPADEIFDSLTEAEKAFLRAKDLTHQLLTYSQGGAPIKEMVSIKELIMDSTGSVLKGSNISCEFSMPDDLWLIEVDDKGQISQVISNLIINDKQAMPGGGTMRLEVENKKTSSDDTLPLTVGKYIKVTVEDHGVGIQEKNLQRIFDPYFTTKGEGRGLGLATSYSIVKRHGGHISVESEDGVGTTFYLYLPASEKKAHRRCKKRKAENRQRKGDRTPFLFDLIDHRLIRKDPV